MVAVDEAVVHRVDHVRRARQLGDPLHLGAGALQGRDQGVPLGQRQVGVDRRVDVHPRVDRVVDAEVLGPAHEVATAPRQRTDLGHGHLQVEVSDWRIVGQLLSDNRSVRPAGRLLSSGWSTCPPSTGRAPPTGWPARCARCSSPATCPPASRCARSRLADGFQVARSTVREALQVLAGEGLVTRYPNRGVVVTELTERDIAEIFEARLVLERAGVRAGAGGRGPGAGRRRRCRRTPRPRAPTTRSRPPTRTWSSTPRWSRCSATPGWSPAPTSLTGDLRLALASVERARRNARSPGRRPPAAAHADAFRRRGGPRSPSSSATSAAPPSRWPNASPAPERPEPQRARSPTTSAGATAPTCHESTPSAGLSRSTHQPSSASSRRA